jgi:signal transduction histidine kinase
VKDETSGVGAALQRAREEVRLRDEFLTMFAHELKNTLATLTLALSQLGEAELDASTTALAPLVERQARSVNRLMSQLLSAAQDEVLEPLIPDEICLASLVREVVAHFALELQQAECQITLNLAEGVVGRWDRMRVEQVVFNLLSNACKFGKGRPIEIHLGESGAVACLEVIDHGCGVAPADRPRLFTRFGRGTAAHGQPGLGLGLYTVRRIVEAHGGRVTLASKRGGGCRFTVDLPLNRDALPPRAASRAD